MEYHQTKKADSGTVLFRTHTNKEESNIDSEEKEELRSLPQADKDLLDGIVCFINKHLDHPDLSVDTLVEEAGISRSALFKR